MATPAMLQDQARIPAMPARAVRRERLWIQIFLFLLTFFTTTMVGMRYMVNFQHGLFPLSSDADVFPFHWVVTNLSHFALGLPFSVTLLTILLTHEFGHYFACRHYNVRATLPYLLPAPSLSGTAGAVIRLKSRVKSRPALISIGAIGPIAGFLVAFATAILGLALSKPVVVPPRMLVHLQSPLLFHIVHAVCGGIFHLHRSGPMLWHPIYMASWIGALITSLNLIPAGQLDGGHILYALSPRAHRISTYLCMAVLVVLGVVCWMGWLLWVALLCLPGMRHPPVQDSNPLKPGIFSLALIALAIMILTAIPQPFTHASLLNVISQIRH